MSHVNRIPLTGLVKFSFLYVITVSDLQEVEQAYKNDNGISQDEARLRFLRVAVTWPTYGSVFFEVKVSFLNTQSQK